MGVHMITRVKQFYRAITANLRDEDIDFIEGHLNKDEQDLFFKLRLGEQYHSLQVAYGCFTKEPNNEVLIKAALLHDIGKIGSNLTTINKSLVVIVKALKLNKNLLPTFLKEALNFQLQHPERGYMQLKSIKVQEEVLELVRYHHTIGYINENVELLKQQDELN